MSQQRTIKRPVEVAGNALFSSTPSRVRERKHFDYLMNEDVPKHSGATWCEDEN